MLLDATNQAESWSPKKCAGHGLTRRVAKSWDMTAAAPVTCVKGQRDCLGVRVIDGRDPGRAH